MRNSANNSMAVKSAKNIQVIVKENDLAISKDIANCSCVELLSATYDIVSKLFDKQTVAKAIERISNDEKTKSFNSAKNIKIIVKENDLTISKDLMNCSCSDLLLSIRDIASKLFDKQTVAKAIERINPSEKTKSKTKSRSKSISILENKESVELKSVA